MNILVQDQVLNLQGHCSVEDSEALHQALFGLDQPKINLSEALSLHTSIVQLIMVSGAPVSGLEADIVLQACFQNQIVC